jgi:hypothetical protein
MGEDLHYIDTLFYSSIESLTDKPSPGIWLNIEKELERKKAEEKKTLLPLFKKSVLVLFALLLSVTLHDILNLQFTSGSLSEKKRDAVIKGSLPNANTQDFWRKNKNSPRDSAGLTTLNAGSENVETMKSNLHVKTSAAKSRRYMVSTDIKIHKHFYSSSTKQFLESGYQPKKNNFKSADLVKNTHPLQNKNQGTAFKKLNKKEQRAMDTFTAVIGKIQKDSNGQSGGDGSLFPLILYPEYAGIERKKAVLNPTLAGYPFHNALPVISHSPPNKNKKHFLNSSMQLTTFASPEIAGYHLKNDFSATPGYQTNNKYGIKGREKHLFSFSSGVLAAFTLKNNFAVQSGLTYSWTIISIDPTKIYSTKTSFGDIKFKYNLSSGYTYITPSFDARPNEGDSLYTTTAYHTLQSISIPVLLKYRFQLRRFTFNPGIGLSANIITSARIETIVEKWSAREKVNLTRLDGLRKFNLGVLITPEIQYRFSKSWGVSILPYFKYSLTPINSGNIVKTYPYNIGLGAGAVYFIKRK